MSGFDEVAAALARHPGEPLSFLVGSPPFLPPSELAAALARAAVVDHFDYGPIGGLPALRRLLAAHMTTAAAPVSEAEVVVTHGAKGGLLAILSTLLAPGDTVLHPAPCYPAFPAMVRRLGGIPLAVPETGSDFAGWAEAAEEQVDARCRALIVASPSNPTGATLSPSAAAALVAMCRRHRLRLILDEAYLHFAGEAASGDVGALDPELGTLIRLRSAAKSWAVPGWRLGWVTTAAPLAQRVAAVETGLLNPPNTPCQHALLSLPEVPAGYLETARRVVAERLGTMADALTAAGLPAVAPAGGFYLWLDLRAHLRPGQSSLEWCVAAAQQRGVALWPGEDFAAPGFARLAVRGGDGWPATCAAAARRLLA